jgi:hypothetical protein
MEFLRDAGIDAYFSGCLTMTFPPMPRETAGDVLFVDALRDHFFDTVSAAQRHRGKSLGNFRAADRGGKSGDMLDHKRLARTAGMPEEWCDNARQFSARTSRDASHDTKFELAASMLEQFAKAKIIVTSRLHTLLPAMALGIPCMFVLKDEVASGEATGSLSDQGHDCTRRDPRLSGMLDRVHCVTWSQLLDGLPAEQWVKLAAESPCHEPGIVTSLSTRVRNFIGE